MEENDARLEFEQYLSRGDFPNVIPWLENHLYVATTNTSTLYDSHSYTANLDIPELNELRETVRSLQRELREVKELLSNTVKQKEVLEHRKLSI